MHLIQFRKVDVRLVHHVIGAKLDVALLFEDIQDFDIVNLSVADVNKTWNRSTQIQKGVKFYGGFCHTIRRSRIQAETQIDGGSIEFVNGCNYQRFELGAGRVVGVKRDEPWQSNDAPELAP